MKNLTWDEFRKIELRAGTIIEVKDFPEAKTPAYKIKINLGDELGVRKTSAQLTGLYSKNDLINKKVIVVTNLGAKQIGKFISECLITGFYRKDKKVVLAIPESNIPNGSLLS